MHNSNVSSPCSYPPIRSVELCPFHDGPETLDGLLAEISPCEIELLDAALDLRHELARNRDAEAVLIQLFRLRRLLDGRHYLAFYRLRCWLQRVVLVQARPGRNATWQTFSLPLNGARLEEIIDSTLASLTAGGDETPLFGTQVRFVFAASSLPRRQVQTTTASTSPAVLL